MPHSEQKTKVMKYKLIYTGLILYIYILGKCVPLYGIDLSAYGRYKAINAEEVLMQTISGDTYRHSIFALGIFPFMISGILVQVAMAVRKSFSKSQVSPKMMNCVSAMMTFLVAIFQALVQMPRLKFSVEGNLLMGARVLAVVEMVTGVMVILWLSKRNEKYGVGGRMVLGLVNILERITTTVLHHNIKSLAVPLLISMMVLIIVLVMENTEKRIPVQRISIHNIYADKNYIAIKLNPVGVMPVMFSMAVFMLPQLLLSLLGYLFPYHEGILWWRMNITLTKPLGILIYISCEYLLTIFFSFIMLSPKDIMEQFLKSGDSIVNLHAGRDTRRYLLGTIWRIGLFSATVMGVCIAVPLVLQLRGDIDSTLTMLPSSVMMLTSLLCAIYRELVTLYKNDSCRPLF